MMVGENMEGYFGLFDPSYFSNTGKTDKPLPLKLENSQYLKESLKHCIVRIGINENFLERE